MTFTMYPLGDTAFIERVLNGVAMYSGSGQIGSAVACSALLGVIVAAIQGVFNGGREIAFGPILLGIVLYMMMFETGGVTVVMQDQATGAVRVVDNVPIGVALPSYLFSSIGKGLTEGFETAYSTLTTDGIHGMGSGSGFASSLKALMNIRQAGLSQNFYNAADQVMNGDFEKTMQAYLQNCTLNYYEANPGQKDNLVNQPVMDAIKSTNPNIYTPYYLNTGETEYSCPEAYTAIDTIVGELWANPGVNSALNTILGVQDLPGGQSVNDPMWQQKINYATQDLGILGNTATSAQEYVETAIIWPILHSAIGAKYNTNQDQAMAMIMNNEWDKRLLSWNAQYTFFSATIKPLMTFFEGLVYGITPFVAILLVMGGFGIRLALKYFMIIIWVQLWMPMLAICNLFIVNGAHDQMISALTNNAANSHASFYLLTTASEVAKTWLGIGSYMGTSVPMIAMFIVSGSFYGMSSLANAISASSKQAADTVADQAQPDTFNMGAMDSQQAAFNSNLMGGHVGGTAGSIPKFNFGSTAGQTASLVHQHSIQAANQFTSGISNRLSNSTSSTDLTDLAQTVGASVSGSHSKIAQDARDITSSLDGFSSWSSSQKEAVQGVVGLTLSGQMSAKAAAGKIASISGGVGASGRGSSISENALSAQLQTKIGDAQKAGFSQQDRLQYQQDMAAGWQKASRNTYGTGANKDKVSDISNKASEVEANSKSYSALSSIASSRSTQSAIDPFMLANPASPFYMNGNETRGLVDSLKDAGLGDQYEQAYNNMLFSTGGNQAVAERAAALQTATNASTPDAANAQAMAAGILAGKSGTGAIDGPKTESLDDPSAGNVMSGSQISAAQRGLNDPKNQTNGTPSSISGSGQVAGFVNKQQLSNKPFEDLKAQKLAAARAQIAKEASNAPSAMSAYSIFGMKDTASQGAKYNAASFGAGGSSLAHDAPSLIDKVGNDLSKWGHNLWNSDLSRKAHALGGSLSSIHKVLSGEMSPSEAGHLIGREAKDLYSSAFSNYMNTSSELYNNVSSAFGQSWEHGVQAYQQAQGQIFNQMVNNAMGNGLTHTQAEYFAASTMDKFDDMLGMTGGLGMAVDGADHIMTAMGGQSMFNARNQESAALDKLKEQYGDSLGGQMGQILHGAAGNKTFASTELTTIAGYNSAAGMKAPSTPSLVN